MKVKANYGISCDKGYFETGNVFEIDPKDLPMYGDAVTVVEKAPEIKAEPKKETGLAENGLNDGDSPLVQTEKTAEKPRTARTRTTQKRKTE